MLDPFDGSLLLATTIGPGTEDGDRQAARQGVDAPCADREHVVGGERATELEAPPNGLLPEPVEARIQGSKARVSS